MGGGVGAPPTRFFVDVAALPTGFGGLVQVMTLTAVYAVCMYAATKHGMLAGLRRSLLFRHAKVVYHVALPLASVFPALAMVATSSAGLATTDGLDIGMGLLAGSTVASLSLFWFATVLCGRVTLGDGDGLPRYASAAKLVPPGSLDLTGTGVAVSPRAQLGAQMTLLTASTYVAVLLPTLAVAAAPYALAGAAARISSLLGLAACAALLVAYLWRSREGGAAAVCRAEEDKVLEDVYEEAIVSGHITLKGIMHRQLRLEGAEAESRGARSPARGPGAAGPATPLQPRRTGARARLHNLLLPYHRRFADPFGALDVHGLCAVLRCLGEPATPDRIRAVLCQRGRRVHAEGSDTYVDFVDNVVCYLVAPTEETRALDGNDDEGGDDDKASGKGAIAVAAAAAAEEGATAGSDGDVSPSDGGVDGFFHDGEDAGANDVPDAAPATQRGRLAARAALRVAAGAAVAAALAAPLVECLFELANRTGVPPFYVAFMLAPALCDAAARSYDVWRYAGRQTVRGTGIALTGLTTTASLNATAVFAVAVAAALRKGAAFAYCPEALTLALVAGWAGLGGQRRIYTLREGLGALATYPVALLLVAMLRALHVE